jgi:carbon storage regulator
MLVIRRRPGEAIRIGEDVEIEIIECGPNRVKLGVRAPKEIPVWRAEVHAMREQNIAAAAWARSGRLPPVAVTPDAPATEAVVAVVSLVEGSR